MPVGSIDDSKCTSSLTNPGANSIKTQEDGSSLNENRSTNPSRRVTSEGIICTDPDLSGKIRDSIPESRLLAQTAHKYILHNGTRDYRYRDYFGASNPVSVLSVFEFIANVTEKSRTWDCQFSDKDDFCVINPSDIAITSDNITWYCKPFFPLEKLCSRCAKHRRDPTMSVKRTNILGAATLHELAYASHAATLGSTGVEEEIYGCDNVRGLEDDQKVKNADNYSCFAMQVFVDTACASNLCPVEA